MNKADRIVDLIINRIEKGVKDKWEGDEEGVKVNCNREGLR